MRNQSGMTTVEVLISLFIVSIILTSAMQYYESYSKKMSNFGERTTAKSLAISVMENQMELVALGDTKEGTVFADSVFINGVEFVVVAKKEDAIKDIKYYDDTVPFYKITSIVAWKNLDVEVVGYVSAK